MATWKYLISRKISLIFGYVLLRALSYTLACIYTVHTILTTSGWSGWLCLGFKLIRLHNMKNKPDHRGEH